MKWPKETTMITSVLIPKLQSHFPGRGLRIGLPPGPCAVFPGVHPEVGDIEIYDGGYELTVVAEKFTHGHFSNYDNSLSVEEKADDITECVVIFLEYLFADRVILWGSHQGSGGWFYAENEDSDFPRTEEKYLWSGPLTKGGEQ
jgi:hypothetical protein